MPTQMLQYRELGAFAYEGKSGYSVEIVVSSVDDDIDNLMPTFDEWEIIADRNRPPDRWYDGDEEKLW